MQREQSINIKSKMKVIKGTPNLTPLVDVFFLLLIFFMLSSSFVQLSGQDVKIPKTTTIDNKGVLKMVVTIDKTSKFFFNDKLIPDLPHLKAEFSNITDYTNTVIIRADKDTPFGIVAQVMSLAKSSQLNAFVLTSPAKAHGVSFRGAPDDE